MGNLKLIKIFKESLIILNIKIINFKIFYNLYFIIIFL